MIKELFGYQLVSLNEKGFTVRKEDETKHFVFVHYDGDCCGFNKLRTELLISESDTKNNPIITNVEFIKSTTDDWGENLKLTFFGVDKKIAEINSYSSSDSGWCYGACQWVTCVETNEEEILTKW